MEENLCWEFFWEFELKVGNLMLLFVFSYKKNHICSRVELFLGDFSFSIR